MVDDYIARKQGRTEVVYELPELEPVLAETYGVIAYQEQVMRISNVLAGFTLGEADLLRKAMGKKDPDVMAKMRGKFVNGAKAKGHHESDAHFRLGLSTSRAWLQQVALDGVCAPGPSDGHSGQLPPAFCVGAAASKRRTPTSSRCIWGVPRTADSVPPPTSTRVSCGCR
jgi:hypothetical protein